MQAVVALEEGDRNMHAHVQAAAAIILVPYDTANRDVAALLRLLCDFRTGSEHRWALKVVLHPEETAEQRALHKVTRRGLFSYCLKQRFTSIIFRCAPCHDLQCCSPRSPHARCTRFVMPPTSRS